MADLLRELAVRLPLPVLLVIIAGAIFTLSKGADILVSRAVALSRHFRVSPILVGATIVSLGTTTPETAVSVLSALEGDPGLALGNAVGSVICNGALIIGVAALIRPIPVDRSTLRRQGSVQFASAIAVVLASFPFLTGDWQRLLVDGGRLPQWIGFVLVGVLVGYLALSVRWSRKDAAGDVSAFSHPAAEEVDVKVPQPTSWTTWQTVMVFVTMALGLAIVIVSSQILIPAVEVSAIRIGVPRAVVAASLVALGTSLPELVTAVTASRRGHSELAFGNVVGANVLNVFFVAGLSAAVTPGGLAVAPAFYRLFYPAMIASSVLLYGSVFVGRGRIGRGPAVVLIVLYVALVVAGYAV